MFFGSNFITGENTMGIHGNPPVTATFDFSAANWIACTNLSGAARSPELEAAQTCPTINNKAKTKGKGQKSVSINFTVSL